MRLVQPELGAITFMLRRAPTPEGEDGYTLYHHSLAQHMAESEHCRKAVATAREFLADLADAIPEGPLAPYLFRRGIPHLLETGRAPAALGLLTRFSYLMARLQTLKDPDGVQGIAGDWRTTLAASPALDSRERLCEAFWREREHILRRGDERWPAYKILLQLAVEHADDSPVTREAEAWLAGGNCDWVWLRNPQRVALAAPDPCLRVLEGHTDGVNGVLSLPDGRLLSWSGDRTLRLWDGQSGQALGEPITDRDLPWIDPWLLFQRNEGRAPRANCRYTARWDLANTGGIATCTRSSPPVCWSGNSRVVARDLFSEGILVVTLASGHVFCLQLYRSARRISIEEYENSERIE